MLLTVTQAAEQLATDTLTIHRLAARGKLKANRVGVSGPQRILSEDLSAYVSKGAPDFELPPLVGRPGAQMFDGNERNIDALAGQVHGQIRDALKEIADALSEPAANVDKVAVRPDAIIRAIAQSKPALMARIKTSRPQPKPFADALELVMVHAVRAAAVSIAKQLDKRRAPIDVIYFDRGAYETITAQAIAAALAVEIRYRRAFPAANGFGRSHDVTYSIRLADLVTGNAAGYMARIVDAAF